MQPEKQPPRVKRHRTKDKQLPCVKVDEAMESRLVSAAGRLDVSLSEAIRLACAYWLANEPSIANVAQ